MNNIFLIFILNVVIDIRKVLNKFRNVGIEISSNYENIDFVILVS